MLICYDHLLALGERRLEADLFVQTLPDDEPPANPASRALESGTYISPESLSAFESVRPPKGCTAARDCPEFGGFSAEALTVLVNRQSSPSM